LGSRDKIKTFLATEPTEGHGKIKKGSKMLNISRWVFFLPAAILAAWPTWIVVNILGRFSLGYVGVTPEDFHGKLYFMTSGHTAFSGQQG
jgi:hypothetical protein